VGNRRRHQATAAARNSIGGSLKKRVTRDRQHLENRCGLVTCRRHVLRSSLRQTDERCGLGSQGNEALTPRGILCCVACGALLINQLLPSAVCDS
jgi:hypothetical protein